MLPREAVGAPRLEASLDGALGSLVWWGTTDLWQRLGLGWEGLKVPPNHSNDSRTTQPQPSPCAHKHSAIKHELRVIKQQKNHLPALPCAPQHSAQKRPVCAPHAIPKSNSRLPAPRPDPAARSRRRHVPRRASKPHPPPSFCIRRHPRFATPPR